MAFNDLQLKVAAETAIMGLQPHMASLKYFAHNFKELEDRKGSAIAVPVYSEIKQSLLDATTDLYNSLKTKIEAKLDPMNSYERRIVHNILTDHKFVYTESEGEEPNRYVVIKSKEDK